MNSGSAAGEYGYSLGFQDLADHTNLSAETVDVDFEGTLPAGERRETERSVPVTGSGKIELLLGEQTRQATIEPESKGPRIREITSISEYQSYGDVTKNAGEPVEPGEDALLGVRHLFWHDDGTLDYDLQARFYDPEGNQIEFLEAAENTLIDVEGWEIWDTAEPFRLPENAQPGEYQVDILMRNRTAGETGERETGYIEVQR
jgi:hypothetical protein